MIRLSNEEARAVPLSSVTVVDAVKGHCSVLSSSRAGAAYEVRALGARAEPGLQLP